ncbi:Mitochondrial import inner membrane translocase subunit tim23 [Komagataella kurtzmanii]|nr:Mitochondrial import inner membrane translocase subunit tim23 [Komagataella kurtzmanii]
MVWPFGGNNNKEQEAAPESSQQLQQTLGFDPSTISDVSNIIKSPGVFDTNSLHPLAGLDKDLEYLDLEDEQLSPLEGSQGLIASRGWSDDLCYGTGTAYLLGLGTGGLYGFREGVANLPKGADVSGKLKLNTILNHVTRRGPFLGNSAGVLAVTYNIINSTLDSFRGKHDTYNSLAAGALAGAIFKSSKGVKPMAISSGLMVLAAGAWCGLKELLS